MVHPFKPAAGFAAPEHSNVEMKIWFQNLALCPAK
jgi:hypothetical protein